ncbi:MAG TPA: ferritin-like domain-containing protein, partial [Myxococcales bacterium]|nr:ferritin-like domain-containing protein [Myxococcales bacterium]
MPLLDLSVEAQAANFELTDGPILSNMDRGRAIATWRGRMVNEHVSARVFAALIPQMMKAGLSASWQERVALMIQDELRHGRQCAAVVHALGGEPIATLPPLA